MQMEPPVLVWDLPTRVFHWLLVLAFAVAYASGDAERWMVVHALAGYTVLALVAFRIAWGFAGTRYARFSSFCFGPRQVRDYLVSLLGRQPEHFVGHNPAGSWAIYVLLALGAASGLSGWLALHGLGGKLLEELHEFAANAMLAVAVLHVAGAVGASVLHRENLVRAMVDGRKRARREDGLRGPVWPVGVLLLAGIAALWVAGLRGDLPELTQPALERQERQHEDD